MPARLASSLADEYAHLAVSCGGVSRSPAQVGPGRFCFFVRKASAFGQGHVGCAFDHGSGYTYGGIEDNDGDAAHLTVQGANDGWYVKGTESSMITAVQSGVKYL